jgi:EPS-associated MarR family transcriptional regulator
MMRSGHEQQKNDAANRSPGRAVACLFPLHHILQERAGTRTHHPLHHMTTDESSYRLLRQLEANPAASQRELAREMGMSLGKVNFCLRALIDKGMVKANNFKSSQNKLSYLYVLTPKGVESKATLTGKFLSRKVAEYEALQKEIAQLRQEIGQDR